MGEVVERVQQRVSPLELCRVTIPTLSPNPPSGCNRLYSHRRPVCSSTFLNQPIYRAQGNLISEERQLGPDRGGKRAPCALIRGSAAGREGEQDR